MPSGVDVLGQGKFASRELYSFIPSFTKETLESTYSVGRKSRLCGAGRMETRFPPLPLAGHIPDRTSWPQFLFLFDEKRMIPSQFNDEMTWVMGLGQCLMHCVAHRYSFSPSCQDYANHRGVRFQLWTEQAMSRPWSTQGMPSLGICGFSLTCSRNADGGPGKKESHECKRCQGWCSRSGMPLCFVISI